MKKYTLFLLLIALFTSTITNAQFGNILKKAKKIATGEESISQEDAGLGLKQALEIGVKEAVDSLSEKNGFFESPYKILLPEEARKVTSKLKMVPGFENVEKDLIKRMNEAAELSAKKATPIFVDAITSITFEDALSILSGNGDAATRYLESKSKIQLYDAFLPIIQESLDAVNARSLWKTAVSAYNKIPFVSKTNPELDDHVNNKALDGMFGLIEKKEEGIRNNVDQRSTDLLRRVFK